MQKSQEVTVVSNVKASAEQISDWLRRLHALTGLRRFRLFVEKTGEAERLTEIIGSDSAFQGMDVVAVDATGTFYAQFKDGKTEAVSQRQVLVLRLEMEASEANSWVISMDLDELIWLPESLRKEGAGEPLKWFLNTQGGAFDHVRFGIAEYCPEPEGRTEGSFPERACFKRLTAMKSTSRPLVRRFLRYTFPASHPFINGKHFRGHTYSKSAFRGGCALPVDVHGPMLYRGTPEARLNHRFLHASTILLLHYDVYSLEHMNRKLKRVIEGVQAGFPRSDARRVSVAKFARLAPKASAYERFYLRYFCLYPRMRRWMKRFRLVGQISLYTLQK